MSNEDRAKISACLILFVEMDALQKQLKEQQETLGKLLCDVIGDNIDTAPKPHLTRVK